MIESNQRQDLEVGVVGVFQKTCESLKANVSESISYGLRVCRKWAMQTLFGWKVPFLGSIQAVIFQNCFLRTGMIPKP